MFKIESKLYRKEESKKNMADPRQPIPRKSEVILKDPDFFERQKKVRNLILDYALGALLLGLIPNRGFLAGVLLVASLLQLWMMGDIGAKWGYRHGQDLLAILGNLFGGLACFGMAFMAWVTVFSVGLFVPYVGEFAIAAALFSLTWGIGQATNQFYASGRRNIGGRRMVKPATDFVEVNGAVERQVVAVELKYLMSNLKAGKISWPVFEEKLQNVLRKVKS